MVLPIREQMVNGLESQCHPSETVLFSWHSRYVTPGAREGFGDGDEVVFADRDNLDRVGELVVGGVGVGIRGDELFGALDTDRLGKVMMRSP